MPVVGPVFLSVPYPKRNACLNFPLNVSSVDGQPVIGFKSHDASFSRNRELLNHALFRFLSAHRRFVSPTYNFAGWPDNSRVYEFLDHNLGKLLCLSLVITLLGSFTHCKFRGRGFRMSIEISR